MRRRSLGLRAFVLALSVAAPASATVIVLEDDRSVFLDSFYSCGITSCSIRTTKSEIHDGVSPTFVAGVSAIGGHAFQTSATSTDGIFGHGITESGEEIDILSIDAESVLSITFEVTEDTPYYLFGSVDIAIGPFSHFGSGSATVLLSDAGGTIHDFSVSLGPLPISPTSVGESQAFAEGGVLAAGVYTLFAQADQTDADVTTSQFEVHLALPEPATALLFGMALLVVAARTRR